MFDQVVLLWSLVYFPVHVFQVVRKAITMAINTNSPSPPRFSYKRVVELPAPKRLKEVFYGSQLPAEEVVPGSFTFLSQDCPEESMASQRQDSLVPLSIPRDCHEKVSALMHGEFVRENICCMGTQEQPSDSNGKAKKSRIARKRPASIVIPESRVSLGFGEAWKEDGVEREFEVEGNEYCVASRKGNRHEMEDGYGVMTNINGDSKQALFGVFDGHGGRAAVDFVSEKLGKNIIAAVSELKKEEDQLEGAIKAGYLTTDEEFLSQGVTSGACAATVLLKNGKLHVANVGDCRVVMSRKGVANALTSDHHASREDERIRIESLGGYVNCRNGVWRVQDSLAISRSIGDATMKEWIISEPEIKTLRLMPDCEFLILASDGLWSKVTNQEAVDIVLSHKNSLQSCKNLVDISSSRGSRDDITVMKVDLQKFVQVPS